MALRANKRREGIKHALIWFVLLTSFFPLYLMVVISFKDNVQFTNNPWWFDAPATWHWENWAKGWACVQNYIANSVVTSVGAVILGLVTSLLASYAIARYRFAGRNIFYYGLIASMFLPGTAATLVTMFTVLEGMRLINNLWALVLCGAVGGQVVCVFILRQFIDDIPKELFESAEIDGAGHLQQIWHIVVPMSGSVMGTLAIMQFLSNWNNLMLPLVIMRDDELLTVPVGLMRLEGEYVKLWGEMMAGYTISAIPLIILFLFTMRLFVKGISAGAVKG
ncbi:carbohydrate ABC transporter permease [bacterium]|nr:carbohydrate ABC transporter permease [bacterium]